MSTTLTVAAAEVLGEFDRTPREKVIAIITPQGCLDLRAYWLDRARGKWRPSQKGICLKPEHAAPAAELFRRGMVRLGVPVTPAPEAA